MQMTFQKWAKVFIVLSAGAYLFAGVASLMHFHGDCVDHNNCPLCNYYQNCQHQDLTNQSFVVELLLLQTFSFPEPVVSHTKVVFHNDTSRAPPQLQIV
jgi:hypothetical protein